MIERPHTLRAFLLAPLIVPVLWSLAVGVSWQEGLPYALGNIMLAVISSLPFIYGAALLGGLPAYWVIRRRWNLRPWHPALIGGILGAVVLPTTDRLPLTAGQVSFGALLGLAAGVLFWILWRPRPNPALNPPGLRPAG